MASAKLALLWHMHQPVYRDPASGEYVLPWVRLHATRSYYDMARVLSRFEGARATVNFAPSLLRQLLDYAEGAARDRFFTLTERPAGDLSQADREFLLKSFFMVSWETGVKPLPRYAELLDKRGRDLERVSLPEVAKRFSAAELRDLQVLFNLAWTGFSARDEEPILRELLQKGRNFSEGDKHALLQAQAKIVRAVVPAYRELARAGIAELTVSPFFHPILPLLIDSDSAARALPQAVLPGRFCFPEDARAQIRRALDYGEAVLGARPRGMWPSEGSVSPEAVEAMAAEGVRFAVSDEGVLMKSLPAGSPRERCLYRSFRVGEQGQDLSMVFRDHGLSDFIGFTYARATAATAVDDLLGHLQAIARTAPGGEAPLVTLALDGENPWEHYPESGRHFLEALYGALQQRRGGVEPVLLGTELERNPPQERIRRVHSGSWIDANFRVWIGHPEDNLGWELLREARRAFARRQSEAYDPGRLAQAYEALLVAEGSDWFWWFGDDFVTESLAEFDALFRGYLEAAYRALGLPAPARLAVPISPRARARLSELSSEPLGLLHPTIDGRVTSYLEWIGAGSWRPSLEQGSMHGGGSAVSELRFGFDLERLFLRVDPQGGPEMLRGRADRLKVVLASDAGEQALWTPLGEMLSLRAAPEGEVGSGCFRDILELELSFGKLGYRAGQRVGISLELWNSDLRVERIPAQGVLTAEVPTEDFERFHWRV